MHCSSTVLLYEAGKLITTWQWHLQVVAWIIRICTNAEYIKIYSHCDLPGQVWRSWGIAVGCMPSPVVQAEANPGKSHLKWSSTCSHAGLVSWGSPWKWRHHAQFVWSCCHPAAETLWMEGPQMCACSQTPGCWMTGTVLPGWHGFHPRVQFTVLLI